VSPHEATFQGPGWRARVASHTEEVQAGALWHPCGCNSETADLREVLLVWPGEELCFHDPPQEWLMLARPNLARLREQTSRVVEYFRSHGVAVQIYRPSRLPPPNLVFARDLFFMTPRGAVLSRMASAQRAGEERFAADALAEVGIPILRTPTGRVHLEGADVLWINEQTVMVGIGARTNTEGLRFLSSTMEEMGVRVLHIRMPPRGQHLLGLVAFVDTAVALVSASRAPTELVLALQREGIRLLEAQDELVHPWAMNLVALAPRHVVLPSGAPRIRALLESEGIHVDELNVSEYLRAAGGVACLTAVVRRDMRQAT